MYRQGNKKRKSNNSIHNVQQQGREGVHHKRTQGPDAVLPLWQLRTQEDQMPIQERWKPGQSSAKGRLQQLTTRWL